MRWSPGPISKNIEDRRSQWQGNPEGLLAALQQASIRGDLADPNVLPPWMQPQSPTTETAVDPDLLAFLQAFRVGQ
jgi:hypothetical protein